MRSNLLLSALTAVTLAASSSAADTPSSLLLFPEFNSGEGYLTLITVVNTNSTQTTPNINSTQIDAHYIYVNGANCQEFDRVEHLTPNDLVTVVAKNHNPNAQRGYLFVYAEDRVTHKAVKWDYLIGSQMQLQAFNQFNYSYNPIGFKAAVAGADGTPTDVDNDGLRDLNGLEYEKTWNEILVPSFFGQTNQRVSELVLINLTGGASFDAIIDFLIYDDSENQYSAQYQFRCWTKVPLSAINGIFANDSLAQQSTASIGGANTLETGWFRVRGNVAFSTAKQIQNPSIIAVLDETIGTYGMADVPYFVDQTNASGDLLAFGPFGDPTAN